jgi:hypothetical protein
MRHESDSKDNTYWLGLLTHLQAPSVSRKVRPFKPDLVKDPVLVIRLL